LCEEVGFGDESEWNCSYGEDCTAYYEVEDSIGSSNHLTVEKGVITATTVERRNVFSGDARG